MVETVNSIPDPVEILYGQGIILTESRGASTNLVHELLFSSY